MKIEYMHPADQLVMFMSRIYERGLTTTSGGNLSIRDENGDVWITPAGVDKGTLSRADIIRVKPDGACIGPHKPSSELPFHASVYQKRPDLNAVLHAHPPGLVAFSITRKLPDIFLIPSVSKACGGITMAKYALPGSAELGENIAQGFGDGTDIVLLENHGVVIGARDLFKAFMKFETLEYSANLEILANKIGKPRSLTPGDIAISDTKYHEAMDDFVPHSYAPEEQAARRDMITLIHRSYRQGLFNATHGTYSVRLSDGSFVITPFGRDRAYLQVEDLVRIKNGMKEQGKTPSRAVRFHEQVYQNHPGINAVLLAHPMHVMAFAVTDAKFDPRTIPESYILLREIAKEPYESIFGRPEQTSKKFNDRVPALIFQNDCVVVTGGTLLQAFDRLEVAEATAASIIASREIGKIMHITEKEVEDLKTAFGLHD